MRRVINYFKKHEVGTLEFDQQTQDKIGINLIFLFICFCVVFSC